MQLIKQSKIANTYFNKGDRDKAYRTIIRIDRDIQGKFAFLIQLSQSFFSENDETRVIQIIEEIARDSMEEAIKQNGNYHLYCDMMNGKISYDLIEDFFTRLARHCFIHTQEYFANKNNQAALQEIIKISTCYSTLQGFFNLKNKQSHPRTESPKTNSSSNISHYSILGLKPTASKAEVRKAYKRLALKHHPDKLVRNEKKNESEPKFEERKRLSAEKFNMISTAHEILMGL
ncbi:hypothetical protein PHSC3_000915 [Chlamydiales bacterium STE3]|nr:hypothetical protein PHSC3_000915 [Chlamydiales bacterium STE3]